MSDSTVPLTAREHYAEAERLLAKATAGVEAGAARMFTPMLLAALTHATLSQHGRPLSPRMDSLGADDAGAHCEPT